MRYNIGDTFKFNDVDDDDGKGEHFCRITMIPEKIGDIHCYNVIWDDDYAQENYTLRINTHTIEKYLEPLSIGIFPEELFEI